MGEEFGLDARVDWVSVVATGGVQTTVKQGGEA